MELLNGMLDAGNLHGFVGSVIEFSNEETKNKTLWEYWLIKDWKHSWQEFIQSRNDKEYAAPTHTETLDIVKESMRIMQSFTEASGGASNADIQTAGRDCDRRSESGQNP